VSIPNVCSRSSDLDSLCAGVSNLMELFNVVTMSCPSLINESNLPDTYDFLANKGTIECSQLSS
ncbi:8029_t:CDS:2, partial [Entrophospora sp. SA101]